MNKLFLDIGNSRVKRALVSRGDYEVLPSIDLNEFLKKDCFDCFFKNQKIDSVYIASVTSDDNLEQIKSIIQEQCQLFPIILTSQKSCCGLISGYTDSHQLGDDRWMAMQGAIGFYKEPLIVVSAGTAMTIDAVMDGKHLGGFIVPGLRSLRSSLAMDAAALSLIDEDSLLGDSSSSKEGCLATSTEEAILGGTLYMTVAYINTLITDLNAHMNTAFKVILTGGNAKKLRPLMNVECELIPDLVLQGMINIEESVKKIDS
ncbi:Pantothenate kinase type III, CoaX-like [hydrothermal vent metagenome]|uniref:Type III pantothenate kinase n=1 Tax=hydrothermal vent metagenome TaxID=652676 RepID=A0A3B0W8H0_9ZZZZ